MTFPYVCLIGQLNFAIKGLLQNMSVYKLTLNLHSSIKCTIDNTRDIIHQRVPIPDVGPFIRQCDEVLKAANALRNFPTLITSK